MPRLPFPPDARARVVITGVEPAVDAGRFAVKRTIGDLVPVSADIFADGHDVLAAVLRYRRAPADATAGPTEAWQEEPMAPLGNDRWTASFAVPVLGRWEFSIEAWVDLFGSWRAALERRLAAQAVGDGDLLEGAAVIRAAAARARSVAGRAPSSAGDDARALDAAAAAIEGGGDVEARAAIALDEALLQTISRYPDRGRATALDRAMPVLVERERARVGAWYEMFPRSEGASATASGTLATAAARLPEIAALGFDVLYLPPIHPIGTTARKGRGNQPSAAPGDPGSPWAIGAAAGGHTAVEPSLGTLEDFDRFVIAARHVGLEVALDVAFQTSPDHPYVGAHPEWFRHRPDGSIKYAENPPKKYHDIFPFDFDTEAWPALWEELASVVAFWAARDVRIFRVDNPHTKPFPFWEWLLASLREDFPDLVFLSEAFTKPKVMRHLAKLGFSQSYTYFTWRNTKPELTEYFTEISAPDVANVFRPNLFVNTPDILHAYLQTGGRPAFETRLVLAATLGASYGIYSGFELCEADAVPGTEEYVDSEKYQYRPRDWNRAGHIKDLIRVVNGIRRTEPALQHNTGLTFHDSDNPGIVAYSKTLHGDGVFVVVNLDPHHVQHGMVRSPLIELGLDPDEYVWLDLLDGARYTWRGASGYVRFDPGARMAHIFKPVRT